MELPAGLPGVARGESNLLVLFIPSVDRFSQPIDQALWTRKALEFLGRVFGGATAFPRGQGVWRDDLQDGVLIFDDILTIHCYTSLSSLTTHMDALAEFLLTLGTETRQGAIGYVVMGIYLEIPFPLPESSQHHDD